MEILTWFPARHFNSGSIGTSLLMTASNPTRCSISKIPMTSPLEERALREASPRCPADGCVVLFLFAVLVCGKFASTFPTLALKREGFFCFLWKRWKQRRSYEEARQNRPCLSQTGIKYSSFHPHSLVPHAHNPNTTRGYEIPRAHKHTK